MDEKSLIGGSVAINQFRNAIYEMILVLKRERNYDNQQILSLLKEMGKKIADNYFKFWTPKNSEIQAVLKEIYEFIFYKKVRVSLENNAIHIIQNDCPFCKYIREDAGIAGCNIIIGLIEKFCESNKFLMLNGVVISSKALGDKNCIHQYSYERL